jgi:hypothetical protein
MEESGLWRIQRERGIEVQYLPNGTNVGDQLDRWNASKLTLKWQRFCLMGKPSMLPSLLNRFSYFMNLWWCLWSFLVDFPDTEIIYSTSFSYNRFANSFFLQLLYKLTSTSMLQHPGYWHKNRFGLSQVGA